MTCGLKRITGLIYLAALALTSLPVTAGLLGWCPCGCWPEALVYPEQSNNDPGQQPQSPGEDHHDSHHCRGCTGMPTCMQTAEPPLTEVADHGVTAVETVDQIPPINSIRLIRPPRI